MELYNRKLSLLAFDLDGTLLNSTASISRSSLEKIDEVVSRGVKVTICSGRISYMQQAYVQELGLKGPYIGCNGGLVVNSVDDSIIYSKTIDSDVIAKLSVISRNLALHSSLQTMDKVYFTRGNPRTPIFRGYMQRMADRGLPLVPILDLDKDFGNYDGSPAYKLVYYIPEEERLTAMTEFLDTEPELSYTLSGEHLFEVMPSGIDKGTGIERVAEFYGIPLSQVCAFGDFDNDIPSFQRAGFSVAMGNASDNLKAWAKHITDTNDNHGIATAIAALETCF